MKMAASSLVGLIAITVPNPDVPPFFTITGCRFGLPRPILFTQAIACLLPFGIGWIGFCASCIAAINSAETGFPLTSLWPRLASPKLIMSCAVERSPPAAYQAKTGQRGASWPARLCPCGRAFLLFRRGSQRRVNHAQRLENFGIHLIFPGFAGRRRDQVAQQPDSGVGVLIGRRQLGPRFCSSKTR